MTHAAFFAATIDFLLWHSHFVYLLHRRGGLPLYAGPMSETAQRRQTLPSARTGWVLSVVWTKHVLTVLYLVLQLAGHLQAYHPAWRTAMSAYDTSVHHLLRFARSKLSPPRRRSGILVYEYLDADLASLARSSSCAMATWLVVPLLHQAVRA